MGKRKKESRLMGAISSWGLAALLFIVIAGVFLHGINNAASVSETEQRRMVEENITRAVVSCYAIEGRYPQDIEYLKSNYGLKVDEKKFIVHYEIFGSNIMPDITILER